MPATISQRLAQAAYTCVSARKKHLEPDRKKYRTFALKFPSLIHTCGLAQAVAFAKANESDNKKYLDDLIATLSAVEGDSASELEKLSRTVSLNDYMRLSRRALMAADWLKRTTQALLPNEKTK